MSSEEPFDYERDLIEYLEFLEMNAEMDREGEDQ